MTIKKTIILLVLICLGLASYYFSSLQNTKVIKQMSSAMEPAIQRDSFLRVKIGPFKTTDFKRGDIIVFTSEDRKNEYVSRIIGLPNEHVEINEGKVWINGQVLNEPYLTASTVTTVNKNLGETGGNVVLSSNSYYIAKDSRKYALDSLFFGALPIEMITGKVIKILK
ncbi:MAG: signal peptidase I [Patescibacteria group bacterium]|nr:signal peptidase I [Patescibacteria group bacterium]